MSLLRIYGSLDAGPSRCHWVLQNIGRNPVQGEGDVAHAPGGAAQIQLVIPATEVLLTRATLPQGAKRRPGAVLAFAVEDEMAGEPEAHHASWLGEAGGCDVLAVADKKSLERWLAALDAQGFKGYEVLCETLLLPRVAGEWSFAWDGHEGFVRTGDFEGAATDSGDADTPPMSLRLLVDASRTDGTAPTAIAVYAIACANSPDIAAWQSGLGVPVRYAGAWDWRAARIAAGASLIVVKRRQWALHAEVAAQLRPAAWIAAAALSFHALALVIDWTLLRREQSSLRHQMEARFRTAVPDAVAVADPALQMRRKLADARHRAGVMDSGDFFPMIEKAAVASKELPLGALRVAAYEPGLLSLELTGIDEAGARRFVMRLMQNGGNFDAAFAPSRSGSGAFVVTVRAS